MKKNNLIPAALLLCFTTASAASAENGRWQITEAARRPAAEAAPYIEFNAANHRFSLYTGCNTLTGSYSTAKGRLKTGHSATTLMACEDSLMRQENTLSQAFSAAKTYRIKNGTLLLADRKGRILIKAVRAPLSR